MLYVQNGLNLFRIFKSMEKTHISIGFCLSGKYLEKEELEVTIPL
jgi:hypothetical protein